MKTLKTLLLIIIFSVTTQAQTVNKNYEDGKIWFQLKQDVLTEASFKNAREIKIPSLQGLFDKYGVINLSNPFPKAKNDKNLIHTYAVTFSNIHNIDNLVSEIEASGKVVYVEKSPIYQSSFTPNDPDFNPTQAWGLMQIGAENAWNVGTGNASITVAVVDVAIDITHPDLTNQIWINPGEIANNGIDDDGNGYIDDVNGWDAADNNNDPSPPNVSFSDHGTHVAGIVGAETNNNLGVASIGYGISILAIKTARDSDGVNIGSIGGVYYAAVNNADIISMSWGSVIFSQTLENVLAFASSNGSVLVAAAGNDNTDNDVTPNYPSDSPDVICVASSTIGDVRSSFSNFGTNSIDITAPGSNIYSTVHSGNYANKSGTSMATPMISGLLGLMKSLNPGMPNQDLINCLYSSADNIDAINPSFAGKLGAGRMNAFAAMNCVAATVNNAPIADFTVNFTTVTAGATVIFTDLSAYTPTSWSWNFDNQGLGGVSPSIANTQGTHNVTYSTPGIYEISLTVTSANGSDTETKTGYIVVNAAGSCNELNLDDPTFSSNTSIHAGWNPIFYSAGAGNGFISGNNIYGHEGCAEYFPAVMIGSNTQVVEGVYVWFAKRYSSNPNKTITINVYDVTGGVVVASPIGTITTTMGDIMSNPNSIQLFKFVTPIALPTSSEIAVGVDYSNLTWTGAVGSDSLAIVTSNNGETATSSIGIVNTGSNTWLNYNSAGWNGLAIHHYIFPLLTENPVNVSLSVNLTTICVGDFVNFDATGSTVQDTLLWQFSNAIPNLSNNLIESVIYNTAGAHKAYLEVVGGGCSLYAVDSVIITVNGLPNVTANATNTGVCVGDPVTLTGGGANSYIWDNGVTNGVQFNPTVSNIYTVVGTDANNCSNTNNVTITVGVDTTTTLVGNTISSNETAATYKWIDCNNGNAYISGASNQAYTATATGNYAVEVTKNGCMDTSACVSIIITGINELNENTFNMYPNPAKNQLIIEGVLNNTSLVSKDFKIVDVLGQVVMIDVITKNSQILTISNLDKGIYFMMLDNGKTTYKFIKE